jgi:hypothetical protein
VRTWNLNCHSICLDGVRTTSRESWFSVPECPETSRLWRRRLLRNLKAYSSCYWSVQPVFGVVGHEFLEINVTW